MTEIEIRSSLLCYATGVAVISVPFGSFVTLRDHVTGGGGGVVTGVFRNDRVVYVELLV